MNVRDRHIGVVICGVVVAAALAAVICLSPERLEDLPPICISRLILDLHCWGCGMTRAVSSLVRFQFEQAWAYNWRVYIVAPILLVVALRTVMRQLRSSC